MKFYDSMGFESENGVYVRRVDAQVVVGQLDKARSLLHQADCPECGRAGYEEVWDGCHWCVERAGFTAQRRGDDHGR